MLLEDGLLAALVVGGEEQLEREFLFLSIHLYL